MANKIQIKRGVKANLPTLSVGEPAFTTDTNEFFIGNGTSNIRYTKQSDLDIVSTKFDDLKIINVKDYGAKGDNTIDDTMALQNAITSIGSISCQLYFPTGIYKINANITIPSNIKIVLPFGSQISVSSGYTLTINGFIGADEYNIFNGIGTISGIFRNNKIFVEWFNMPTNVANDSAPILQNIINICQNSKSEMIFPHNKSYRINSTLTINVGTVDGVIPSKIMIMRGNNCNIFSNVDGVALYLNPLCAMANSSNGWGISYFEIHDFNFDNYYGNISGYLNSQAIKIGKTDYVLDGFSRSLLQNILTQNYPKASIEIVSSRMIELNKVQTRGGSGLKIAVYNTDNFCGDINCINCDFAPSATNKPLELNSYATAGGEYAEIRGIHFTDCVFYGSNTLISASIKAKIGDIWFNSCAWDVGVNAIDLYVNENSQLFNIYFNNIYISTYSGYGINVTREGNTATMKNIKVIGGNINVTGTSPCVLFQNATWCALNSIDFSGGNGTSSLLITYSTNIAINNNTQRDTTKTYFLDIGNSSNFSIANNMLIKPINDWTGAVAKSLVNNPVFS